MTEAWLPIATLWWREIVRFLRQGNRIVGALGTPILFWLLLGSGFAASFKPAGAPEGLTYLEYSFPGILALIVLFTAIFSTISVIEDRKEGFLQAVLVAPVSRSAIVLGKVLGGTTLALGQALLLLPAAPLLGMRLGLGQTIEVVGILFVMAFALTALGFLIAWRMDSTQGFHAIMNLVLLPMWLLSGAFFPSDGAPLLLRIIMKANPLTYGLAALRRSLYPANVTLGPEVPSLMVSILVSVAFATIVFWLAYRLASRPLAAKLA